ncbi:MAG: AmmeMemoRadiSam system radical SAM enzyme [Fibrobacter sp.]|nr:AmmeMemoRadiSam system radical SAM enzyme [Fibrobacter sp.]
MHQAILYKKLSNNKVHCYLCNHQCLIDEQQFGFCGVRQNINGDLFTHTYGKLIAEHDDPVEKKPLFHFLPGSLSHSVAAPGCNFRCGFCQNWQISQISSTRSSLHNNFIQDTQPAQIVQNALTAGAKSISCTYTEPTIFFEYALDIIKEAKLNNLKTIFVTNGYMSTQAIDIIKDRLDACNVDLKSYSDEFYKTNCQAKLKPVLKSIEKLKNEGIWVEISTLIIPGQNDTEDEFKKIAEFIAGIAPDIPWHISRFFPQYQFSSYKPTPVSTIEKAAEAGEQAGLHYIYPGNISGMVNTKCINCGQILIERDGYRVLKNRISAGACVNCGASISGVW